MYQWTIKLNDKPYAQFVTHDAAEFCLLALRDEWQKTHRVRLCQEPGKVDVLAVWERGKERFSAMHVYELAPIFAPPTRDATQPAPEGWREVECGLEVLA